MKKILPLVWLGLAAFPSLAAKPAPAVIDNVQSQTKAQFWEILGSSNGGIARQFGGSDDSNTTAGLGVGANYQICPSTQVGASFALGHYSSDDVSITNLQFMAGPTLNLSWSETQGITDAFFVSPMIGLSREYTSYSSSSLSLLNKSSTAFMTGLQAGKRIAITSSITYRPAVEWERNWADKENELSFIPLSFSFFL